MSTHVHPTRAERDEFLVDGCPRCEEYVEMLGRPFDPARFRAFWEKMIRVEWDSVEPWSSTLDSKLGKRLYLVSLQLQAAFGLHPANLLSHYALTPEGFRETLSAISGLEITDPRD